MCSEGPRSAALFAFSTACSVETCDGLSLVFSRSRRSQCPRLFFALFAQQRSRFAIRRTDLRDDTVRNFQNVPMDPIPHQIQRIRLLPDRANARQQRNRTLRGLGIKRNAFPQGPPFFLILHDKPLLFLLIPHYLFYLHSLFF